MKKRPTDKQRLNWMQKHRAFVEHRGDSMPGAPFVVFKKGDLVAPYRKTLREAIDAAIKLRKVNFNE